MSHFPGKERQIEELRRLQRICFPKQSPFDNSKSRGKENTIQSVPKRGTSIQPGAKERLLVWGKYEEKARNLERNFQRFTTKFKSHKDRDPLAEVSNLAKKGFNLAFTLS